VEFNLISAAVEIATDIRRAKVWPLIADTWENPLPCRYSRYCSASRVRCGGGNSQGTREQTRKLQCPACVREKNGTLLFL